jgi:hypothetical protein
MAVATPRGVLASFTDREPYEHEYVTLRIGGSDEI